MTVYELIEKLHRIDPDMPVIFSSSKNFYGVNKVEVDNITADINQPPVVVLSE